MCVYFFLCSFYTLQPQSYRPPLPARKLPPCGLRWTCYGWDQWLRGWVLLELVGMALAWASCRGSAGRDPRWGPCVCTVWRRAWWSCPGAAGVQCQALVPVSCPHHGPALAERCSRIDPCPRNPGQLPVPPGPAACHRCPGQRSR